MRRAAMAAAVHIQWQTAAPCSTAMMIGIVPGFAGLLLRRIKETLVHRVNVVSGFSIVVVRALAGRQFQRLDVWI
ncbi:MAG: hypothetical protein WB420_01245 [Bradyrhizobium sp.]